MIDYQYGIEWVVDRVLFVRWCLHWALSQSSHFHSEHGTLCPGFSYTLGSSTSLRGRPADSLLRTNFFSFFNDFRTLLQPKQPKIFFCSQFGLKFRCIDLFRCCHFLVHTFWAVLLSWPLLSQEFRCTFLPLMSLYNFAFCSWGLRRKCKLKSCGKL